MLQRPYSGFPRRFWLRHTPLLPRNRHTKVYGSIGSLQVQLARTRRDVRRAQRLRYQVFYNELSAVAANSRAMFGRRDFDRYDRSCDHLLVVDRHIPELTTGTWQGRPRVVGTYRILRQDVAERVGGFYSQGEFDIAPLVRAKSATHRFMELGRSCVLKPYRTKRTVELLWQGLWTYVREHDVDVMIGCASFEGTDPTSHAMALSYLHHYSLAPDDWCVRAHERHRVRMDLVAKDAIDIKAALKAMPPLIKGYLRLGAYVGDGAVIDRQFNTVDVFMVLPVERIDPRYFAHFGAPTETQLRHARPALAAE